MTFEVEIGGRVSVVAVEAVGAAGRDGGCFRVTVARQGMQGPPTIQVIDARGTDLGLSMVWVDGSHSVDVAMTERAAGEYLVQLPRVSLTATVDARRVVRASHPVVGAGEQRVVAPMPGRVVRVLVQAGDEVIARQGLVVVEAMKMENELTAPRAGRVKDVSVTEGLSVEAGRLLVTIE
jgi:biotin carboxyl carrier protein